MKKVLLSAFTLLLCVTASATRLFLVGDATPQGWNNGEDQMKCTELIEVSNGIFQWTGKLYVGNEGFKVSDTPGQWGDYHPTSEGLVLGSEPKKIVQGGPDIKWKLQKDGIYTVTIDWTNKTIKAEECAYTLNEVDGVYQLATAEDVFHFSQFIVHGVLTSNSKAVLTADIDYTAEKYKYAYIGIGQSEWAAFAGEFDGQGHKITINMEDLRDRTGLFSFVNNATIKNLWVDGTITMKHHNRVGGLGGHSDGDGTRIDGVLSTVTINDLQDTPDAEFKNDGTIGGLFANIEGNGVIVSNCAFLGTINAPKRYGNGGLIGLAGSGTNITIKNCLVKPKQITWAGGARVARNTPTISNVYAIGIEDMGEFHVNGSFGTTPTEQQIASGEFCYWLNESQSGAEHWYQTIGTDATPLPIALGHKKVYANDEFNCNNEKKGPTVYANVEENKTDPHQFGENDLCKVCKKVGKEPTNVGGVYQIANIGNLVWFASHVNDEANVGANAVITTDIEQGDAIYTPIGSEKNAYIGHFDGKNHSVTLALDNSAYSNQGLFGFIYEGVVIENLIVKGFVKGKDYVGGIAGATCRGADNVKKITIRNCGNEATVTATGANGAGVIGCNIMSSGALFLENVYNSGEIHSGREGGALSGWSGGEWSEFINCYNTGKVYNGAEQSKDFTRHEGTRIKNCYYLDTTGTNAQAEVKPVTEDQLKSGELCVMLGGSFTQNLTEDQSPVFGHKKVGKLEISELKYATYVAPFSFRAPEGVTANTAENYVNSVSLTTVETIPQGAAVVLNADAKTVKYFNEIDEAVPALKKNDLLASTEPIEVTEELKYFVLANGKTGIGFYPVKTGTSIPANKAYLLNTPSSAKQFIPLENKTTGISNIDADNANGQMFNIAGQRIAQPVKGQIYIVNGKKIIK